MKAWMSVVLSVVVLGSVGSAWSQTAPATTRAAAVSLGQRALSMYDAQVHSNMESLLNHPGVPEADKEKLRLVLKEYDAGMEKLRDAAKDQSNEMAIVNQAAKLGQEASKPLQDRTDLCWIGMVPQLVARFQSQLLLHSASPQGKPEMFLDVTKAAGIDAAGMAKIKAVFARLQGDLADVHKAGGNPAGYAERQAAAAKAGDLVTAARKEMYAALTPQQKRDLDWATLHVKGMGADVAPWANFVTFSTLTHPVTAPQDGNYSVKCGDKTKFSTIVTTVTLKKGQAMGFRTVGKSLKAFAGDKEYDLPDPLPAIIAWQFDGEE